MSSNRPQGSTSLLQGDPTAPTQGCVVYVAEGHDADLGKHVEVGSAKLVVGSGDGCGLTLADSSVSRQHVELELTDAGIRVTDLGSTNGTKYLGSRIEQATVGLGATLHVGTTRLSLLPTSHGGPMLTPSDKEKYGRLLGRSVAMRRLFALLERLEQTEAPVLIHGETGTGKELVAEALHEQSDRKDGPLVIVDCGSIPDNLAGSELFGHMRGAFTGAASDRAGAFEEAHGGTLFLDEIGELPLALQPQLLRALESRKIKRIGSNTYKPVDVRVVAATHRELDEEVEEKRFRQDLFFRLAVIRLEIPPLRERREDIALLIEHFAKDLGRTEPLPDHVMNMVTGYAWPGNVRELRNAVTQILSLGELHPRIKSTPVEGEIPVDVSLSYKEARDRVLNSFEQAYVRELLERAGGNLSEAARQADLSRKYLRHLANKHGLRQADEDE